MKKNLLLAAALCLASSGMAQTIDKPLSVTTGENTYKVSEQGSVYWQFTADNDYIATIGKYGDSDVPYVAIKEGDTPTQINGITASDYVTKIYALQKGKTYYFFLNDQQAASQVGFTLQLEKTENLGVGLSEDNPMEIKLEQEQVFGNPNYKYGSWDMTNIYTTYKAEKDGMLLIKTAQTLNYATVNGEKVYSERENNLRVLKINTEAGKTYSINFELYGGFFIATSEVVQVKEGSIDKPYSLKDGENEVPAEAGKYYFTYKPTKTGYFHITSSNKLTDGQVKIYTTKANASSGYNAKGQSEVGSYDMRTELKSISYTYYIVVDKKTATSSADTFNFKMEDYEPGESADNPIVVEVNDATPTPSVTVPSAKGTYYYSITVPANTIKYLVVKSATDLSSGSSVSLKETGAWRTDNMEGNLLKKDVSSQTDKTYILTVTSNEEQPLNLTFSYAEIEKGTTASNPKEANVGKNTIDFDGNEYYSYKATKDCKLAITVNGDEQVKLEDLNLDTSIDYYKKDKVFFTEAKAGHTYTITISNTKQGATFNLAETEFDAGEARTTAITMNESTYTLGDETANLWLKYTVKNTGLIDFSCDVPYDSDYSLGIAKNENDVVVSMVDEDYKYQSTFPVTAGDVLYIHVNMTDGAVKGKTLTLVEREPKTGESASTPIPFKKGDKMDVSGATTLQKSIWLKAKVDEGQNIFFVTEGSIMPSISPKLSSDGINYDGSDVLWDDAEYNGVRGDKFVITIEKDPQKPNEPLPEYVLIRIYNAYQNPQLEYIQNTPSGISSIEVSSADSKPSIYKLDGTQVNQISGAGVYIIKSNGVTKKVVIKK